MVLNVYCSLSFTKNSKYMVHQTRKRKNSSMSFDSQETSLVSLTPNAGTLVSFSPIVSSYNDRIRPILDAIDKLRHLKVMQEGIQLPTIVVVGDQSSGKSSVLESLAGISLPRGQGICTRVPLIMRLQHHTNPTAELHLEYQGKSVPTDESQIAEAINVATNVIAGKGKGISHTPLTLVVKKNGVPDLTMVDLPGITRVPVHGQPENIYEQISEIIMEFIKPEESIILNVLSAAVDFTICESIRMSQLVDKNGERTLAVVTKSDKAPEGLLEKVTRDDVSIGLGYVCVRNRVNDESYEEARREEMRLFESHPLLSKIDKSMVSVPVLAQRLVLIQASIISKCLPDIVRKINDKLNANTAELSKMPQNMSSVPEALTAFMRILGLTKESLRKLLLRGEFDEYPDDRSMHGTSRLLDFLNGFSKELLKSSENRSTENFLEDVITVMQEANGISLPNFLPRSAFMILLQRKVNEISQLPVEFVNNIWDYIEKVVVSVLMHHSENYPQLKSSTRRAAENLMVKLKEYSIGRVMEIVEMEKLTDYTCDGEYMLHWNKLMATHKTFKSIMDDKSKPGEMTIDGFGSIQVAHLRAYPGIRDEAFDMKMRITAYWKVVIKRMVDNMALQLLLTVKSLVNREMETDIVKEVMSPQNGGGIEALLEESPFVATKRERLNKSIKLLKESKVVMANIMDRIAVNGD